MAITRSPNAKLPSKPDDLNAPFFNAAEVAWLLDISVKTVYRRVQQGAPCSRNGTGPILVSQEDLQHWYRAGRIHPVRQARRASRKPLLAA